MKAVYLGLCAALMTGAAAFAADPHAAPGAPAHWEYTGETGAEKWGSLSPDYQLCSTGQMQSPIDIADGFQADGAPISLNYNPSALNIIHNGHTIQANFQPGSSITVSAMRYDLLQVHFHTPSEHAKAGERGYGSAFCAQKRGRQAGGSGRYDADGSGQSSPGITLDAYAI